MTTPEPGTGGQRGARPIDDNPHRRRRPWWLLLLLAVVVIVVLLLLLSRCGGSDTSASGVVASATSAGSAATSEAGSAVASATSTDAPTSSAASTTPEATTSAAPATSTAPTTSAPASSAPAADGGAAGSLTSAGTALLPLTSSAPDGTLTEYAGQPATADAVTVQSVPADEGFWVGTSATDRVWVQLTGSGESPYTVRPGDTVSFTAGKVVANPSGYPARVGLAAADGAAQLTSEAAHVEVAQGALTLNKG